MLTVVLTVEPRSMLTIKPCTVLTAAPTVEPCAMLTVEMTVKPPRFQRPEWDALPRRFLPSPRRRTSGATAGRDSQERTLPSGAGSPRADTTLGSNLNARDPPPLRHRPPSFQRSQEAAEGAEAQA